MPYFNYPLTSPPQAVTSPLAKARINGKVGAEDEILILFWNDRSKMGQEAFGYYNAIPVVAGLNKKDQGIPVTIMMNIS